jgi:hypothetical protein
VGPRSVLRLDRDERARIGIGLDLDVHDARSTPRASARPRASTQSSRSPADARQEDAACRFLIGSWTNHSSQSRSVALMYATGSLAESITASTIGQFWQ